MHDDPLTYSNVPEFVALHRHYENNVLPVWRLAGFDPALQLPFDVIRHDHRVATPSRYRAMACARQLFVFSEIGDRAHADILFASLKKRFQDTVHGGFFYSIGPDGLPLDSNKDLYTHAFVIFAAAAYHAAFKERCALDLVHDTADIVAQRFSVDPQTGLPNATMDASFATATIASRQNPLMHLTEAYLQAHSATRDRRFDTALNDMLPLFAGAFVDPTTKCVMELPQSDRASWIEPGHQFEWLFLSRAGTHPSFEHTGLRDNLLRAFEFAERHGVAPLTGGVAASIDRDGQIIDGTQRIWAQTEYLRALACHPDSATRRRSVLQAERLYRRFMHAAGWYECLDSSGAVSRDEMPSTTPYHLASAFAALR